MAAADCDCYLDFEFTFLADLALIRIRIRVRSVLPYLWVAYFGFRWVKLNQLPESSLPSASMP